MKARDIKRFNETKRINELLNSITGRQEYMRELEFSCRKSSLIFFS